MGLYSMTINKSKAFKIVITGGHHSSAVPVIKKLRESYPQAELIWFGHKFSALGDKNPTLEFHEITALGLPFYHIHAGKFYRTLNIKRLAKIPFGFFQCLGLLIKLKPDAILSFGGYIAVPTVLAGRILGIPAVTHEQTVVAGWANRLISKVAQKVLISWRESEKYFPKDKVVFVGLPLRKEIFEIRSNSFVFDNTLPVVYITTGKIGSHIINRTVGECLAELLKVCNVIHQVGDNSVYNDFEKLDKLYEDIKRGGRSANDPAPRFSGGGLSEQMPAPRAMLGVYYPRKFVLEDEIGEAYGKADLVVSRSGAHTTAELLELKKRCILVPIPWVSHNEQNENAKLLVDAGLGVILPEKDLSAQTLIHHIQQILVDSTRPDPLGLGLKSQIQKNGEFEKSKERDEAVPKEDIELGKTQDPAELIVERLLAVVNKSKKE